MLPGAPDSAASPLRPPPPPPLPDRPTRDQQMDALTAAGEYLFGQYKGDRWVPGTWGWQTKLALRIAKDPRSLRRWLSGQDPVDATAWELVKLLVRWRAERGELP